MTVNCSWTTKRVRKEISVEKLKNVATGVTNFEKKKIYFSSPFFQNTGSREFLTMMFVQGRGSKYVLRDFEVCHPSCVGSTTNESLCTTQAV